MDRISIVVTQLLDYLLDSIEIFGGSKISYDSLEATDIVSYFLLPLWAQ